MRCTAPAGPGPTCAGRGPEFFQSRGARPSGSAPGHLCLRHAGALPVGAWLVCALAHDWNRWLAHCGGMFPRSRGGYASASQCQAPSTVRVQTRGVRRALQAHVRSHLTTSSAVRCDLRCLHPSRATPLLPRIRTTHGIEPDASAARVLKAIRVHWPAYAAKQT